MTKGQALQSFFSSFGRDAYPTHAVPDDVKFPYLTYEAVMDSFRGYEVSCAVDTWDYTTSEATANAIAEAIGKSIDGGTVIACDDGYIWIKKGSPWSTPMADATSDMIKRRRLNVTIEYLTN